MRETYHAKYIIDIYLRCYLQMLFTITIRCVLFTLARFQSRALSIFVVVRVKVSRYLTRKINFSANLTNLKKKILRSSDQILDQILAKNVYLLTVSRINRVSRLWIEIFDNSIIIINKCAIRSANISFRICEPNSRTILFAQISRNTKNRETLCSRTNSQSFHLRDQRNTSIIIDEKHLEKIAEMYAINQPHNRTYNEIKIKMNDAKMYVRVYL